MRTRLRLGAAAAVGLGVLLLATVLASPALAWHTDVSVDADCFEGHVRATYTVTSWKTGEAADVDVSYTVNGGEEKDLPPGKFTDTISSFEGFVDLPAGTTGEIEVFATAHWKGDDSTTNSGTDELPAADECKEETTTTSEDTTTTSEETTTTSEDTTSTAPSSSVAPTTSTPEAPTTTDGVGAPTTTAGGQLPFTGAGSSQPMLLAGIALVVGGGLFLLVSRERRATR
jgi:LPXTG-motif cell wall-anchored protein